jgi:hypothetical protein
MAWSEAIGEVFKFLNSLFHLPSRQIQRVVNIYDAMHEVLGYTDVQRFIIFKAHNGGGLIKPNTPLYVSALFEDFTAPFDSVRDKYQKIEVDEEYIRMLAYVCRQKVFVAKPEELKDDSLLKQVYHLDGVKYSEIYYLGQDKRNLYFCSCVSSTEEAWQHNDAQKATINLAINSIRNNIK